MNDKITVVGFPMLNEQGTRDGFTIECSTCGPVEFVTGDEELVHELIFDHMTVAHGVEPAGFVFKDV